MNENINQKRILITGAGSYIGESFRKYVEQHYPQLHIETLNMHGDAWKEHDFSKYDSIFHVAGIAHADIGKASKEDKQKYYDVNTKLAVETARKARTDGAKQFIFMSSMLIYGDAASVGKERMITRETEPSPSNFYGDSKWQADKRIQKLGGAQADKRNGEPGGSHFTTAIIRCPMVYGPGCKGNYRKLEKLARICPIFPDIDNKRSMIHIDNLCEFVCRLILSGEGGIFFPQDPECISTSEMYRSIRQACGKKTVLTKLFNPLIRLAAKIPGKVGKTVSKVFGSIWYEGEKKCDTPETEHLNKKALVLASVASMIDQFNIPNIEILISLGYKVDVAADFEDPGTITEERAAELKARLAQMGVRVIQIGIPRSINPKALISSYKKIRELAGEENYTLVHCQSPIGGALCRMAFHKEQQSAGKKGELTRARIIYMAHGFHFYTGAPLKNWLIYYPIEKWLSRYTDILITINKEDYRRAKKHFHAKKTVYVPGIGIDLEKFSRIDTSVRETKRTELGIPEDAKLIISVGELSTRKNHRVVIEALNQLDDQDVYYVIVGRGALEDQLRRLDTTGRMRLPGYREDVPELLHCADLFVFPSLQEGLPVAPMEAMAAGLPVICSDIRGSRELVDKTNRFEPNDQDTLKDMIVKYLNCGTVLHDESKISAKMRKFSSGEVNRCMMEIYKSIYT